MNTSFARCSLAAALLALSTGLAAAPAAERLRSPEGLDCPRDRLTSYAGAVRSMARSATRLRFAIRSDQATDERFSVSLSGAAAESRMTVDGGPFSAGDWSRLTERPGRPRPGLRATVWLCEDKTGPRVLRVDWTTGR